MNSEQYKNLKVWTDAWNLKAHQVRASDLRLGGDRTLLYGYTCSRATFHVYMEGGQIHRLLYGADVIEHTAKDVWTAVELVPDKRVYPEYSAMSFCEALVKAGVDIPFTNYRARTYSPAASFHGLRVQDFR